MLFETKLLMYSYFALSCGLIWCIFFKKSDNKVCINAIELLIIYHTMFTDHDRLVLISKLINEVDFNQVPEWQKNEFKNKIKQIK